MQNQELPASLAYEGNMMLEALLDDLLDAGVHDICITRDPRLPALGNKVKTIIPDRDIWKVWKEQLKKADAVFLVAPETDNTLYNLTKLANDSDCRLLGCSLEAVAITGSKLCTIKYLSREGIPTVPSYSSSENIPGGRQGWVIKPDDGVGAEHCLYFSEKETLKNYIALLENNTCFIVQPYIKGYSFSISLLCNDRQSKILACNEQLFRFHDGKGQLEGLIVNGITEHRAQLEKITDQIMKAIPGLWGFVGIDLIMSDEGPLVVEINPRLTTSYVGLRQSLQHNPAEWLLGLLQTGRLPEEHLVNYSPVTIKLV